ncbi:hypothetical protein Syun_026164 [Stephania yunnanensis]|uniref:Uncharacterized protein n=1 Tax=Stephania yunnanensis TaxID=152371 RepID=A0AAP0HW21_9MAGN
MANDVVKYLSGKGLVTTATTTIDATFSMERIIRSSQHDSTGTIRTSQHDSTSDAHGLKYVQHGKKGNNFEVKCPGAKLDALGRDLCPCPLLGCPGALPLGALHHTMMSPPSGNLPGVALRTPVRDALASSNDVRGGPFGHPLFLHGLLMGPIWWRPYSRLDEGSGGATLISIGPY